MGTLPSSCEEKGERYFSRRKRMVLNERHLVGVLILGLDDNMNIDSVYTIDIAFIISYST